jgi:hypothetical protein
LGLGSISHSLLTIIAVELYQLGEVNFGPERVFDHAAIEVETVGCQLHSVG